MVRIAAKRPNSAAILTAGAADRHRVSRYPVKKALVCNPETPVGIPVPPPEFMPGKDLLELARFHSVNPVLERARRGNC